MANSNHNARKDHGTYLDQGRFDLIENSGLELTGVNGGLLIESLADDRLWSISANDGVGSSGPALKNSSHWSTQGFLTNNWPLNELEVGSGTSGLPPSQEDVEDHSFLGQQVGLDTTLQPGGARHEILILPQPATWSEDDKPFTPGTSSLVHTEHEDSWNEDEHNGRSAETYSNIRAAVAAISHTPGRYALTKPLSLRQRRAVHLIAHLHGCSHVSVGSFEPRQVLIACDGLDTVNRKRIVRRSWTGGGNVSVGGAEHRFEIVPTSIAIRCIPKSFTVNDLWHELHQRDVPMPAELRYDENSTSQEQTMWNLAIANFDDAEDVARFCGAMQGTRLRASDKTGLQIQYIRRKLEGKSFEHNGFLSVNGSAAAMLVGGEQSIRHRRMSQDISYQGSGYSSGINSSDNGSQRGGGRGRRLKPRAPRIKQGYPCSFANCSRVFDRRGECTKHEKIHMDKSIRPHHCEQCDKGFLYAKDLRRHQRRHDGLMRRSSLPDLGLEAMNEG